VITPANFVGRKSAVVRYYEAIPMEKWNGEAAEAQRLKG